MEAEELLNYSLGKLKQHLATRSIPKRLNVPEYDKELAKKIVNLMYKFCQNDTALFDKAIKDFIAYSSEFLELQIELEKTGNYLFSSYKEAQEKVYQNPEVMENRYLNGLFLSQAFWINHHKMLRFFIEEFCINNKQNGKILEVPVGSGIFISEFAIRNKSWRADGYDISISSVEFAKKMLDFNGLSDLVNIRKKSVFDLHEVKKYDKVVCGELLEHLEDPEALLHKLRSMLADEGKLFLTTAIWAAAIDHIYLFKSAQEVRNMLEKYFHIEKELILNVFPGKEPEDEKTPINYACILRPKNHGGDL